MPVPGAATSAAQAMGISVEDMKMAGVAAGVGGAAEARQWEIENAESYRSGEINDAELGMANLQQVNTTSGWRGPVGSGRWMTAVGGFDSLLTVMSERWRVEIGPVHFPTIYFSGVT
jgi:hypothetical protein